MPWDTYVCRHHRKLKETISTVTSLIPLFYSLGIRRNEIKHFHDDLNKHLYIYLHQNITFKLLNAALAWTKSRVGMLSNCIIIVCFVLIQKKLIYWIKSTGQKSWLNNNISETKVYFHKYWSITFLWLRLLSAVFVSEMQINVIVIK